MQARVAPTVSLTTSLPSNGLVQVTTMVSYTLDSSVPFSEVWPAAEEKA